MPSATVDLAGKVIDGAGADKVGLTVELWETSAWETPGARTAATTTDSDGLWAFSAQDITKTWVVCVIDGAKKYLVDARTKLQITNLDIIDDISVNTIYEHTAASGVTIDGVVLKDSTLNAASFAANWTNAGRTVADLGIVTTVDINGGTVDGTAIGGATPAAGAFTTVGATGLITATGGQIAFPVTQVPSANAHCLDDYEEGSWTPGLTFGGAAAGMTFNAQVGYYTKIGNTVRVSAYCALAAKGTSTGTALLTGLPFTIANNNAAYSAVTFRPNLISFADVPQASGTINTTTIGLEEITVAGAITVLDNSNFGNTSSIIISFIYQT